MTQHRDRKQAIRARMAATGEPYSEAARQLSDAQDEARLAERAEAEAVRRCNACTFPRLVQRVRALHARDREPRS